MRGAFFLAWRHLLHHAGRSAVIVLAIAVIVAVPMTLRDVISAADARLTERAEQTPLVIGAKGSRLDLVMSALYFGEDRPEPLGYREVDRIWDTGHAEAIPVHLGFYAADAPVVGTEVDYFRFRNLEIAEGRGLAILGEALVGSEVALREGLSPGSAVISTPQNLFDLTGSYPLQLNVVGVLAPTGTADDQAVFVDIRTSWVMEGIGHGHDDLVGADARAVEFQVITAENVDSFHFHGDVGAFPVSAIIALPFDQRSSTILRGQYLNEESIAQVAVPREVIAGLIETVFAIAQLLDRIVLIVGGAALLAIALALHLSIQLRKKEMETAFRLGASRIVTLQLVAAEVVILSALAGTLATLAIWLARTQFADTLLEILAT
ncbi:MAG: ABC transporter permease [Pseudomonadota bacterium]